MSLVKELVRRNVFRVVLAYAAAAWVLVEVMDLLTGIYEAPSWVMKSVVAVVLLGFVPVVILSWVYQVTPDGVRKDGAEHATSATASGHQLNTAVIVMVVVAIGFFVAGRLSKDAGEYQFTAADGPPMIAVLPFVSKSLDGDSEFFAAGVHDDLLTKLAQLQSMRVISRTSVMEYRDTEINIREIGNALGADAILEGGVQSAGNRIRINAQLIDARTDEHLWAQTYDRDLSMTNIFDVQTEIARAITVALETTLTDHDADVLTTIPTQNMAAYRAYRRAKEIQDTKGSWMREEYLQALEEAVALDPGFTRAWVDMVQYLTHANYFSEHDPALTVRAEEILERIRELAPDSADHLVAQSYYVYYVLKDYDQANELISQAHALRPSDTEILAVKSWIQRRQGDFDGRIETLERIRALNPGETSMTDIIVQTLMMARRYDEAGDEIIRAKTENYRLGYWNAILQLREHGDLARWAADVIALGKEFDDEVETPDLIEAYLAVRDFTAAETLITAMPEPDISGDVAEGKFFDKRVPQLLIYWFLGDEERLTEVAMETQRYLDRVRSGRGIGEFAYAQVAGLIAAVRGDAEESMRLHRIAQREGDKDLTARTLFFDQQCATLGIAGLAKAAVDCIRTSLEMPSLFVPFLDPFLPHYDPIREDPAFVALLAELGDAANSE